MNIKQVKRKVLEQEFVVSPNLEERILNDRLTERDIAFLERSMETFERLKSELNDGVNP